MEKQEMIKKTEDVLKPFETENLFKFIQNLSFESMMDHPVVLIVFLLVLFYGIIKRSKPVLLFLFAVVAITILIRFTLPQQQGTELTLSSILPFAFGGVFIGGVIIYFGFIKGD